MEKPHAVMGFLYVDRCLYLHYITILDTEVFTTHNFVHSLHSWWKVADLIFMNASLKKWKIRNYVNKSVCWNKK